jgi:hypothetical protein
VFLARIVEKFVLEEAVVSNLTTRWRTRLLQSSHQRASGFAANVTVIKLPMIHMKYAECAERGKIHPDFVILNINVVTASLGLFRLGNSGKSPRQGDSPGPLLGTPRKAKIPQPPPRRQ